MKMVSYDIKNIIATGMKRVFGNTILKMVSYITKNIGKIDWKYPNLNSTNEALLKTVCHG